MRANAAKGGQGRGMRAFFVPADSFMTVSSCARRAATWHSLSQLTPRWQRRQETATRRACDGQSRKRGRRAQFVRHAIQRKRMALTLIAACTQPSEALRILRFVNHEMLSLNCEARAGNGQVSVLAGRGGWSARSTRSPAPPPPPPLSRSAGAGVAAWRVSSLRYRAAACAWQRGGGGGSLRAPGSRPWSRAPRAS